MKSILGTLQKEGTIESTTALKSKSLSSKKAIVTSLVLTPLVDAFAILVIYLLVQSTTGSKVDQLDADIKLPVAKQSKLLDDSFIISIKNSKYLVDKKIVSAKKAMKSLAKYAKSKDDNKKALTIISDKKTAFDMINPLLEWSSLYGVEKVQLAVVRGGKS